MNSALHVPRIRLTVGQVRQLILVGTVVFWGVAIWLVRLALS
jgi:hypothetical protein